MGGRSAAGAPAFFLIVSVLLVPAIQAAVAKPKLKPKPKATARRVGWKRMSPNISWQWQLDDNGSISKVKVRWNRDCLVHERSSWSALSMRDAMHHKCALDGSQTA